MKIIGDDGTVYELTEKEDAALATIVGVYITALNGETGDASKLIVISQLMYREEVRRVVEIIGKTLAHKIGKQQGKTVEEVELETMKKIAERSESPADTLKKMLRNG